MLITEAYCKACSDCRGFGRDEQKADGSSRRRESPREHGKHGGKQAESEYSTDMLDNDLEVQYVIIFREKTL